MALALEDRAMSDDIMAGDTPKAKRRRRKLQDVKSHGRLWKHSTLSDIDGLVSADDIEKMFTFTLVRNPWDRMVSYYYWLQDQNFDNAFVTYAKTADFDAFLRLPDVVRSFRDYPARAYMITRSGFEKCDLYIRLEHLAEDIGPLEEHLGFPLEIAQVNRSQRSGDYRSYYSDSLRAHVADVFAEDIQRFGYHFDAI